jgi:hypothetical protein
MRKAVTSPSMRTRSSALINARNSVRITLSVALKLLSLRAYHYR